MLGVSVPIGGGRLQAAYVEGNDRTAANKDANQIAVGYLYPLSKAVSASTAYGRIRNEHGALFYDGNATDAGAGNRSFNRGMATTSEHSDGRGHGCAIETEGASQKEIRIMT
jgi:predicted porin